MRQSKNLSLFKKRQQPATFETVTETVVVQPQSVDYVTVPAKYETYQEAVVVQEASTELVTIPATFETVTETVVVQEASTELVTIPATYENHSCDIQKCYRDCCCSRSFN